MPEYLSMDKDTLRAEKKQLEAELDAFKKLNVKLDMSRGKPSAQQLDLSMGLMKIDAYKDDTGVDARNYGHLEGLPEARKFFAGLLGAKPEETVVGGNSSLDLMYMMLDLGCKTGFPGGEKPWREDEKRKFLCPVPGYDRHFRVSEVFGFELVMVPMTPQGPDMDVVEELVKDPSVKGIWCIPVYSNPDGYTYSAETVERLANMNATAPDFRIFWDNAYGFHHFTDVKESCPNLLDACRKAGNENRALMFCSTSKMTFAGAGISAMAASEENVRVFAKHLMPMMICFDKLNQLRHVRFFEQAGGVEAHMEKQAQLLRPKFEKVFELLHENLDGCGDIAHWTEPRGGYFISLYVMDGCAKRTVAICKENGVVLTGAGAAYPYGIDPDDRHIRIAPTFPPMEELETAAKLLCTATRLASVEKLLAK